MEDTLFISRLPANFDACGELIKKAMANGSWQDVGRLAHQVVKGKDICASYRLQEESLELYGKNYRVDIVHSDAHDRRRQKRIAKAIGHDASAWKKKAEELGKKKCFASPTQRVPRALCRILLSTRSLIALSNGPSTAVAGRAKAKLAR
jgi:hypothetical protein